MLNSPNLSPYFSVNKFERNLLLIFISLLCLINSYVLITKCLILYVICKEKLGVDNWLGLKGLISVNVKLWQCGWWSWKDLCLLTTWCTKFDPQHSLANAQLNILLWLSFPPMLTQMSIVSRLVSRRPHFTNLKGELNAKTNLFLFESIGINKTL